jgi:hypothetical protein
MELVPIFWGSLLFKVNMHILCAQTFVVKCSPMCRNVLYNKPVAQLKFRQEEPLSLPVNEPEVLALLRFHP